jgi:hypothetical protein
MVEEMNWGAVAFIGISLLILVAIIIMARHQIKKLGIENKIKHK